MNQPEIIDDWPCTEYELDRQGQEDREKYTPYADEIAELIDECKAVNRSNTVNRNRINKKLSGLKKDAYDFVDKIVEFGYGHHNILTEFYYITMNISDLGFAEQVEEYYNN